MIQQFARHRASMVPVILQIIAIANLVGKAQIAQNQVVRNHARMEGHVMDPIGVLVHFIFPAVIAAHARSGG